MWRSLGKGLGHLWNWLSARMKGEEQQPPAGTIRFMPVPSVPGTPASSSEVPAEVASVWVEPASKQQLEAGLYRFLRSLAQGRPEAGPPLLADRVVLAEFLAEPEPLLADLLRLCLDRLLSQMGPDRTVWGEMIVPTSTLAAALALHNCLAPGVSQLNPVVEFVIALAAVLPPARTLPEVLAWHALLESSVESWSELPEVPALLLQLLVDRSPLTALTHLSQYTPPALVVLASELLPGWERDSVEQAPWQEGEWLEVVAGLLRQPLLARHLRQRWLEQLESRGACRTLGLLLEMLRRRGGNEGFLLEFYEAYDYFRGERREDGQGKTILRWPLLERIDKLLGAPGDSEAAMRLNRWGNEYLLLFRPLVRMIIEMGELPKEYRLLRREFLDELRPLLDRMTERGRAGADMGQVEFRDG